MIDHRAKEPVLVLLKRAKLFGLSERDVNNAQELVENFEYGLALDTILTQLHEFDIKVDIEFINSSRKISELMEIDFSEYSFVQELVQ